MILAVRIISRNRPIFRLTLILDDANLEAQIEGKTPSLCESNSKFELKLTECVQCLSSNGQDWRVVLYLDDTLSQYLDYCDEVGVVSSNVTSTIDGIPITKTILTTVTSTWIYTAITVTSTASSNTLPSNTPLSDSESESTSKARIAGPVAGTIGGLIVVLAAVLYVWRRKRRRSREEGGSRLPNQFEKPQLHSDCVPRSKPLELEGSEWREPVELPAEHRDTVEILQGPYEMEDRRQRPEEQVDGRDEMQ